MPIRHPSRRSMDRLVLCRWHWHTDPRKLSIHIPYYGTQVPPSDPSRPMVTKCTRLPGRRLASARARTSHPAPGSRDGAPLPATDTHRGSTGWPAYQTHVTDGTWTTRHNFWRMHVSKVRQSILVGITSMHIFNIHSINLYLKIIKLYQ